MQVNGNLTLLRPTIQSLSIDLQHLTMLCRRDKRNVVEKEFLSTCHNHEPLACTSKTWSPAMGIFKYRIYHVKTRSFRRYVMRRLREKVNDHIMSTFARNEINNNKAIGLISRNILKGSICSRNAIIVRVLCR